MLIYKQRYKPRTAREFTGTTIDVYDSADNTALNALTVYGKSEVVDGSIKSAGEGWSTVDLSTLGWGSVGQLIRAPFNHGQIDGANGISELYTVYTNWSSFLPTTIPAIFIGEDYIFAANSSNPNGKLAYQLADPTQGNCIAVKTDNGSGIDGTMATFTTGTPLRGIPETSVRDVMEWDGTSGEVTKNCGEVDLGTLTWTKEENHFYSESISNALAPLNNSISIKGTTPLYTITTYNQVVAEQTDNTIAMSRTKRIYVYDTDYTDTTAFTTAMSGVMLVYELETPTTQALTPTENASIATLRTFAPNTHAQNNAQTEMTVDYTIRVPTV